MEQFFATGYSHHQIEPAHLARCIAGPDQVWCRLTDRVRAGQLRGGMLLATCNRIEIFGELAAGTPTAVLARGGWFTEEPAEPPNLRTGDAAISHLIRVASSLDSLVVGETQITNQLRGALRQAQRLETLSPDLDLLVREALRSAKEIRTHTGISDRSVSIASLTADLLQQRCAGRGPLRVAVLGAGDMATQAALA
jgi:glutamyl-tRNA reductase